MSAQTKFTKGPWSAYSGEDTNWWWVVHDADGHELGSGDGGFEVVDALLMAAAPDLYEALDALVNEVLTYGSADGEIIIAAGAALAKARGVGYDP